MQTLELYFEAMRTHDWDKLASCLADDVHRTGPYLDVVHGKQAYVDFLSSVLPSLQDDELKVSRVRTFDGRSALVELSETRRSAESEPSFQRRSCSTSTSKA